MNKYLILCVAGILTTGGFTASNAEPLRKCGFYEIMNDEDEDGLVQNPKDGPSVCYYTQQDLAAANQKPIELEATISAGKANEATTAPKAEAVIPIADAKSKELSRLE